MSIVAPKYGKLVVALVGVAASAGVSLGMGITLTQAVNVAIALVAALQVWYVTETRDNPSGKAVIAGFAGALVALQSVISGDGNVDLTEWIQIGVAGLTAAGVLVTPGHLSVFGKSPVSDVVGAD